MEKNAIQLASQNLQNSPTLEKPSGPNWSLLAFIALSFEFAPLDGEIVQTEHGFPMRPSLGLSQSQKSFFHENESPINTKRPVFTAIVRTNHRNRVYTIVRRSQQAQQPIRDAKGFTRAKLPNVGWKRSNPESAPFHVNHK